VVLEHFRLAGLQVAITVMVSSSSLMAACIRSLSTVAVFFHVGIFSLASTAQSRLPKIGFVPSNSLFASCVACAACHTTLGGEVRSILNHDTINQSFPVVSLA
jgi:hypothetical protein